jgi:hypothetical protein
VGTGSIVKIKNDYQTRKLIISGSFSRKIITIRRVNDIIASLEANLPSSKPNGLTCTRRQVNWILTGFCSSPWLPAPMAGPDYAPAWAPGRVWKRHAEIQPPGPGLPRVF